MVNELLPSFQDEETDSLGHNNFGGNDALPNGHSRIPSDVGKFAQVLSSPLFPEVDALLSLFKNSSMQLIDLQKQVYTLDHMVDSVFIEIYLLGHYLLKTIYCLCKD